MAPKTSKTPLNDRLGALQAAVVACRVRGRGLEDEHGAAQAEVARLSEARVEAFAAGDEALAGDLQLERDLAVAKVRDCEERVAGAGRAVLRADAEVAQHATHSIDGLLAERTAGAHRIRETLVEAVTGLSEALRRWEEYATSVGALLRLAGRPSDTVPSLPVALVDLARLAKRGADVPVPPPLPQTLESSSWNIAPEHDPDPAVREAARAKIASGS